MFDDVDCSFLQDSGVRRQEKERTKEKAEAKEKSVSPAELKARWLTTGSELISRPLTTFPNESFRRVTCQLLLWYY